MNDESNRITHPAIDAQAEMPAYAERFTAAMGDYVRVTNGQIDVASEIMQTVSESWIGGAASAISAIDGLREVARATAPGFDVSSEATCRSLSPRECCAPLTRREEVLLNTIDRFLSEAEGHLLEMIGDGQNQDKSRQILDAVKTMNEGLNRLNPALILRSSEAASEPKTIIEAARSKFVMAEQRDACARALGEPVEDAAPDIDLF
ncbi:hypothetical protein RGUI_2183 [Rhodovulum sp. P5]|uniref:hypothetical protein n=1 Tax=Rhodovulum sp. P5 TaxID=1564506 RepID=UPI0009C269F6|nr:hypothetical protein [Rhodovulum sp. P5]ARE40324.1 hypothetical protein RGUI_2183 [Rhodovulum sp. P5]